METKTGRRPGGAGFRRGLGILFAAALILTGLGLDGDAIRVQGESASQTGETSAPLPDVSESVKDLYEAETGIVSAPTVVQKIDSKAKLDALDTDGKRTQVAWFALADKDLNVKVDNTSYTMAEILGRLWRQGAAAV